AMTVTIVVCLPTVGALLVVAFQVAPAATAYLLVKELHQMMWVGSIIGALSSVIGMYLSYYLNSPSGAAIVLVAFCFFCLAFFFSPSQGLLVNLWTQRQRSKLTDAEEADQTLVM
ncbi:MAG: metal ABC transporter permease, partial [Cyanobacteria bacterium P01_C01_bin.120]